MRVIAGSAKGIHLSSRKGDKTRPIQDRIKESLFNILASVISGSRILDMYAGTGAIGIEALSRGAISCIFVEKDRSAIQVIHKNLELAKLQNKAHIIQYDVFEIIPYLEKNSVKLDLVFASPPYSLVEGCSYRDRLLILFSTLYSNRILQSEGFIIFQHRKTEFGIPAEASCLELFDTRIYGDTQLSFFRTTIK